MYGPSATAAEAAGRRAAEVAPDWAAAGAWAEASWHVGDYNRAVGLATRYDRVAESAFTWDIISRGARAWRAAHRQAAAAAAAAGRRAAEVAPDWAAAGAWAAEYEWAAYVHGLAARAIGAWVAAHRRMMRAIETAAHERTPEARQAKGAAYEMVDACKRVAGEACRLAAKARRDAEAAPGWAAATTWAARYKAAAGDANVDMAGAGWAAAAGPEPGSDYQGRAANRAAAHRLAADAWARAAGAAASGATMHHPIGTPSTARSAG